MLEEASKITSRYRRWRGCSGNNIKEILDQIPPSEHEKAKLRVLRKAALYTYTRRGCNLRDSFHFTLDLKDWEEGLPGRMCWRVISKISG